MSMVLHTLVVPAAQVPLKFYFGAAIRRCSRCAIRGVAGGQDQKSRDNMKCFHYRILRAVVFAGWQVPPEKRERAAQSGYYLKTAQMQFGPMLFLPRSVDLENKVTSVQIGEQ